jgi:hypothetical protein
VIWIPFIPYSRPLLPCIIGHDLPSVRSARWVSYLCHSLLSVKVRNINPIAHALRRLVFFGQPILHHLVVFRMIPNQVTRDIQLCRKSVCQVTRCDSAVHYDTAGTSVW